MRRGGREGTIRGEGGPGEGSPPPSAGVLGIRLFGGLSLQLDGRPLPPLTSSRSTALLGLLALDRDGPVPRQRLAYRLWPDSTEAQARTNLRKALHVIRHELPDVERFLVITSRSVHLHEGGACWIDLRAFEEQLALAGAVGVDVEAAAGALQRAIDLYRADLLPDLYDDWAIEARERVRDRYHAALARLAELESRRGQHARAIAAASALVRGDTLQEASHRLLMRVHDASGDRAAAAHAYHECVSVLRRELGVEPGPETTALYRGLIRRAEPAAEPGPTHRAPGTGLVGRQVEWQVLTRAWQGAERGDARLVVVGGEPGIGKTRLVEDLAGWCRQRGAQVHVARSYASGGELGYGVATSWLRSLHRAGALDRLPSPTLDVLGRLLPELQASPPAHPLDAASERHRLRDAITHALAATDQPALLVLDDAQWSDHHSLAAIGHLLRLDPPPPVLVAMTLARHDVADDHPLPELLGDLHRVDRAVELTLDRLGPVATGTLGRALGITVEATRLHADTEGIPLFIVETANAVLDGGHHDELSPKLRATIRSRLRRCSPLASRVMGVAATIGRSFTTYLVRTAARLDDDQTVVALDELWRRGIIREHGLDGYDFTHAKLRDVAYDGLSPPERRRNHLAAAEALQAMGNADALAVSGHIARHFELAGRAADAVRWYETAAAEATRRYASDDTVRLLERARGLVADLVGDHRERELAIVTALPSALVGVDGFASERVEAAQRRVVELAGDLALDVDPTVLRSMVMSRLCRRDFEGARHAAEELRTIAARAADDGLLIESDYMLGITAFWTGRLERARSHLEAAVTASGAVDRRPHVARFGHDPAVVCQSRLANTLALLGRPDDAHEARAEALGRAADANHPYSRATATSFAAMVSIDLDRPEEVASYVDALGREHHLTPPNASFVEALRGFVDVHDGHVERGFDRIAAVIEELAGVDLAPGHHACFDRVRVAAHVRADDPRRGLVACDEALSRTGSRLWEPEIRRARAELLAATGAEPEVVEQELQLAGEAARRRGANRPPVRIHAPDRQDTAPT